MCDESVSSAKDRILRLLETCTSEAAGADLLKALAVSAPLCKPHFAYAIARLLEDQVIRLTGQPLFSGKLGMDECLSRSYTLSSEGAWILNERWEVFEPLGRGGMAIVYRGRQRKLGGRPVAVKMPFIDQLAPDVLTEVIERTKREATLLARLNHPAIVAIYDADQDADGTLYFVMELLEGGSLAERLKKRGRLPWEEVIEFLVPAADGLAIAASKGIRHRDIKPQNFMFDAAGRVRVTDFGLAKALPGSGTLSEEPVTRIQAIRGTLQYMAPERLRQLPGADESERADIYSFGVTLYEALMGRHPYPEVDPNAAPMEIHYRLLMTHPVPLHEALPECPRELADAIDRMMAGEPELRYPTFAALANDLRRIGARAARRTTRVSARARAPRTDVRALSSPAAAGVAPVTDTSFAAKVEAYDKAIQEACDAVATEFGPPAASAALLRAIWTLAGEQGAQASCEAIWRDLHGEEASGFRESYEALLRGLETGGSLPPSAYLVPLDLGELLRVGRRQLEAKRRKGLVVDPSAIEKLLEFLLELPDRKELDAWRLPPAPEGKDSQPPVSAPPATTSTNPPSTRRMAMRTRREAIEKLRKELLDLQSDWFRLYGDHCFGWNSSNEKANELLERLFDLAKEKRLVPVLQGVHERLTHKPSPDFAELYDRLLDLHAKGKVAPSDPAASLMLEIPHYAANDPALASTALTDDREYDPAAAREIMAFLRDARDHVALAIYRLPQAPTRPPAVPTRSLPAGTPSPLPTDLAGRIFDNYELVEVIGKGGMGVVYRANDKTLERDVAVKVMSAAVAQEAGFAERFDNEAKNAAKLLHPNLVHVYRAGRDGDLLWYAMELVPSRRTLAAFLSAEGKPVATPRALGIARRIAEGLQAIHDAKLVHRDIKPENVMILPAAGPGEVPHVKILDAGLVKPVTARTGARTTGFFMGTPEYCSPEQAREGRVDGRSDLYSLGVVLYELLAGPGAGRPYVATSPTSYLLKTADTKVPPIPLRERNAEVPAPVAALVHRLLEKDPDRRYPSAAALISAIDDLLMDLAGEGDALRRTRRRRRAWIGGALALLLLALATTYAFRPGSRPEPPGSFEVARRPDPPVIPEPPPSDKTAALKPIPTQDPRPSPSPEEPAPAVTAPPPMRLFPASQVFGPAREDSAEELFSRHLPTNEEQRTLERFWEAMRKTLPARTRYDLDTPAAATAAFLAREPLTPWVRTFIDAEEERLRAARSVLKARPRFEVGKDVSLQLRDGQVVRGKIMSSTSDLLAIEMTSGLLEEVSLSSIAPAYYALAVAEPGPRFALRGSTGDAVGVLADLEQMHEPERRRHAPGLVDHAISEVFSKAEKGILAPLQALTLTKELRALLAPALAARVAQYDQERDAAALFAKHGQDTSASVTLLVERRSTFAGATLAREALARFRASIPNEARLELCETTVYPHWVQGLKQPEGARVELDQENEDFILSSPSDTNVAGIGRELGGFRQGVDLVFRRAPLSTLFRCSLSPAQLFEVVGSEARLYRLLEDGSRRLLARTQIPIARERISLTFVPEERAGLTLIYLDGALLYALKAAEDPLGDRCQIAAGAGTIILESLRVRER